MRIVIDLAALILGAFAVSGWEAESSTGEAAAARKSVSESTSLQSDGGAWRRDSIWDDGKAEFAVYEASWARYGTQFEGRVLLIAVKESWSPSAEVKADRPGPKSFEVLKLNHVRDVPTGIYSYHQMSSVFARRDTGALRKLSATSAEACGLCSAQMVDGVLDTWSYFDGQGHRQTEYPESALPEDGLPLLLRDYVVGELPARLSIFPSLMTGRFRDFEAVSYRLKRENVDRVETPSGTEAGIRLTLENSKDRMSYTFAEEAPHALLQMRHRSGTVYRLAKIERLPYWSLNGKGDENWLPTQLR